MSGAAVGIENTKAMVLAAGRGTRLKELTENTPKPLVKVGNASPLMRTLSLLHGAGYRDVCVNAYYLAEQIKDAVAPIKPHVEVILEKEGLDNGGGVKNALPFLGKAPFIVVNGDLIWSEETHPILAQLPKLFDAEKMDGLLLLIPLKNAYGYTGNGDFTCDLSHVAGNAFGEGNALLSKPLTGPFSNPLSALCCGQLSWLRDKPEGAGYIYGGVQILHPRIFAGFADQKNFPLTAVYKQAVAEGRLYGHVYTGSWADMGTPKGLVAAQKLLSAF